MSKYKQKIHRSLLQREMMGGVPQTGLLLILVLGFIFIYGLQMWFAIVPLAILYFVMRHLSKKDNWFIDMILENIMQKDKLIP